MGSDKEPDPLDIPAFLKRDADNKTEKMKMDENESVTVEQESESRPAKSVPRVAKSNGHDKAPVKAAGKRKVKAAAKAPAKAKTAPKATAKAAKAPDKAKAVKTKAASKVEKDQFGFRKGTTKSEAAALYARKSGATLPEIKEKLGSVQLNVLVALEAEGYKVTKTKEERKGERPVTRYRLFPK